MVDWNLYTDDFLIRHFGVQSYQWGGIYPQFTAQLRTMLLDRIAKIPWLPDDWAQTVRWLHGKDGRALVPVSSKATTTQGRGASFLDTPEKRQVWDAMVEEVRKAQTAYMENELAKGRVIMDRANANAEFWDNAYRVAVVLAAPVTAAKYVLTSPRLIGTVLWGGLALLVFVKVYPMLSKLKTKGTKS